MFTEYYSIMSSGAPFGSIHMKLLFTTLVFVVIFFRYRISASKWKKILPVLYVLAIIGTFIIDFTTNREYRTLKKILIDKEHQAIEGLLDEHIVSDSSIILEGDRYYFISSSDDQTLIPSGSSVRLFYFGDKILGLWVKK